MYANTGAGTSGKGAPGVFHSSWPGKDGLPLPSQSGTAKAPEKQGQQQPEA